MIPGQIGNYPSDNPWQRYVQAMAVQQSMAAQQPQQSFQPVQQGMTPPTRHAEIVQVKSVEDADKYPVNAGTIQLFQLMDDSAFVTKYVYPNGQVDIDIYTKQPKKQPEPPVDTTQFVTREELEKRLAELLDGKKEEAHGESV